MDVGSAAIALNGLLSVLGKSQSSNKDNPSTAESIVKNASGLLGSSDLETLKKLFSFNGNMIKLQEEVIVEPLLVISEDAMNSSVYSQIGNTLLDTFTSNYINSFNLLQDVHGLSGNLILTILGTDNGYGKLASKLIKKGVAAVGNSIVESLLTTESGMSDSYLKLLALDGAITVESAATTSTENKNNTNKLLGATLVDAKASIIGNQMLTREVNVKLRPYGAKSDTYISLPVTIKARLVKVSVDNVVQVSAPNKKFNTLASWLDVKAGISTFADYIFQTSAVKKYKQNRIKGNEFAELITQRKLSAYSKLANINVVGFELNYTLMLISMNDKLMLDRMLTLDIFKEADKNDFMQSTYALATAVVDEASEIVTYLTPKVRGINSITFKELKNVGGKKETDVTDLLQTLFKSKLI